MSATKSVVSIAAICEVVKATMLAVVKLDICAVDNEAIWSVVNAATLAVAVGKGVDVKRVHAAEVPRGAGTIADPAEEGTGRKPCGFVTASTRWED